MEEHPKVRDKGHLAARAANIVARGFALFFGLFSLANAFSHLFRHGISQNVWWIDLSFLGSIPGALVQGAAAVFLVLFAVLPKLSLWRRIVTCVLSGALTLAAIHNSIVFYQVASSGALKATPPLPLSIIIMVCLLFITLAIGLVQNRYAQKRTLPIVVVITVLVALLFPLGQMVTFGKTDYRREADVAVVLGAFVRPSGDLSSILEERVDTAVELYEQGYVPKLLMSGGIEASGVDEAWAMRDYAITKGVPAQDILLDQYGVNTDATVDNTLAICKENGFDKILVVSSFYHLPRIKLAYVAHGQDVFTVPARGKYAMPKLPQFMIREVPAWWVYWGRGLL